MQPAWREEGMLRWIRGGRSDHPLDDKDAPRILLEELSGSDPIPALEQVSSHLDAVKTAENLKPGRAFEIVDLLDRSGRPLQRRLNQEFVAESQRLTKFQQARLWSTVYTYWTQLAEGYRFCLAKYEVGAIGASALKPHLPRITARALRACCGQLKWTLLRYGPVEPAVWHNLGGLYLLAETLQFAQITLSVYRGAKGESSPEKEFLRALMLAVSSPDGLLPLQIEIAERIVARLTGTFRLSPRPGRGIHYIFDVSGERPPGRLPANHVLSLATRCFGPGESSAQVAQMLEFMDRNQAPPPDLALGGNYDPALVQATLRHLERYWSPMLPERKERRRRHMERVSVVHDFEEVVANVAGLFLESPFVSNDEEWVVENESENGFAAFVPQPNGAWLKVGNLIGIRREDGVSWGAGIVRRVTGDDKGNRYVGIQMLAPGGAAVTVLPAPIDPQDPSTAEEGELCILLPSTTMQTGEASLLMRAGLFSPSGNLVMHAYDRCYFLFPLGLGEHSEEFDVGRYRILEVR
jgi:hypothetical protein